MDKQSFLTELEKTLNMQNVADIESIIEEYEEHFKFKIADGYSEEEVAARLGSPSELARQYSPAEKIKRPVGKAFIVTGLVFAGILVLLLFILFFGWVAVLGALTVVCATLGFVLIGRLDVMSLLPNVPNPGSAIMGIASLALAVLAGLGTYYCWHYVLQLAKAYIHWHKRCLAAGAGKPLSPSIAKTPQFKPRLRRRLRLVTVIAVAVFGVAFVLAFVVLALQAGAIEFWHTWGWFV